MVNPHDLLYYDRETIPIANQNADTNNYVHYTKWLSGKKKIFFLILCRSNKNIFWYFNWKKILVIYNTNYFINFYLKFIVNINVLNKCII